ncbi:MAG TPA: 50S ribosomal protein L11 methyltransferase [Caulobacteraceae bacterium]|nr:50S ribosomal protein L11 methyltransferase [Caulobacteraceae bacterium]
MSEPVQILARGPREAIEAAAAAIDAAPTLASAAYSVIEEDETAAAFRLDAWPASAAEAADLMRLLASRGLAPTAEPLADADWLALALSGLPPVRAGRFFVFGVHDRGRVPANVVRLRIEAGAAFGTGHHASTFLCLRALDDLLKRRKAGRVLDLGAGTGILAIAAAKSGADFVIGADIDGIAVRVARENARLNAARCRFVVADGVRDPEVRRAAPFDLVLANILAAPVIALAPQVRPLASPGAAAVLSGILRSQTRAVAAAWHRCGFRLTRMLAREAWACLVLTRRG